MLQCSNGNHELAIYTSRKRIERSEMLSIFMCYAMAGLTHAFAAALNAARMLLGRIDRVL